MTPLPHHAIKRIEKWLKHSNPDICPFAYLDLFFGIELCRHQYCDQIFPTLGNQCPCDEFTLNYVTRRARAVVKEYYERA